MDYSDFVVVTIGTGIGSAIIINNRIYRGHCSMAGEIGYMITGRDALENGPYTLTDFGYFEKNSFADFENANQHAFSSDCV